MEEDGHGGSGRRRRGTVTVRRGRYRVGSGRPLETSGGGVRSDAPRGRQVMSVESTVVRGATYSPSGDRSTSAAGHGVNTDFGPEKGRSGPVLTGPWG